MWRFIDCTDDFAVSFAGCDFRSFRFSLALVYGFCQDFWRLGYGCLVGSPASKAGDLGLSVTENRFRQNSQQGCAIRQDNASDRQALRFPQEQTGYTNAWN
jgi:hypothetical protein